MTGITEIVDLPDPAVQPLVHPLDVPEARRHFRTYYLINALTSPPVAVLAASILWFVARNPLSPLIAAAVIITLGALASRHHRQAAWAFVPRKRQDRQRTLPVSWEVGNSLVFSGLLALAVLLVTYRLGQPDVPPDVRQYTFGMATAATLLVVLDFLRKLLRRTGSRRRTLLTLPGVAAVLGSAVAARYILFDTAGDATSGLVQGGAATMLAAAALVGLIGFLQRRRCSPPQSTGGQDNGSGPARTTTF